MPPTIDTATYDKTKKLGPGQGYSARPQNISPTTIVIHSTNGNRGSTFDQEAKYLRDSLKVSSHFLVGKAGQIAQILDPGLAAWHAGEALTAWTNPHAIGIECHHAVGDDWPQAQLDSLTWLVRDLMRRYRIAPAGVETHRKVAIPGPDIRKHDPSDWPDAAFYAWRGGLATDIWSLWGSAYPLPPEQRPWGIPQLWAENARWLKEARSNPMYAVMDEHDGHNRFVVQAFQGGAIWGLDDQYQLIRFPRELP